MWKPLEARTKKTFSDAAAGGLVIYSILKRPKKQMLKKICFFSFLSNLRNTLLDQKCPFLSIADLQGVGGGQTRRHTTHGHRN